MIYCHCKLSKVGDTKNKNGEFPHSYFLCVGKCPRLAYNYGSEAKTLQ